MKQTFTLLLLGISSVLFAQMKEHYYPIENQILFEHTDITLGESNFVAVEFEMGECITDEQRFQVELESKVNREQILQNNPHIFAALGNQTRFIDPYRPKPGFDDFGYHSLQN
jgi:hypothetical protein